MDVCDCEMSVCLRGCLSLRSVRPSGKNQQLVIGQKVNTRVFMILKSTCMSVRSCNATMVAAVGLFNDSSGVYYIVT